MGAETRIKWRREGRVETCEVWEGTLQAERRKAQGVWRERVRGPGVF